MKKWILKLLRRHLIKIIIEIVDQYQLHHESPSQGLKMTPREKYNLLELRDIVRKLK